MPGKGDVYVRILIQHVRDTSNGAQVTQEQPAHKLRTDKLTTDQVRDLITKTLSEHVKGSSEKGALF